MKNLPRAWFGQQLCLLKEKKAPSFQSFLYKRGGIISYVKTYPLKFLDIFIGFSLSVVLMIAAAIFFIAYKRQTIIKFLPFIIPAAAIFLIFIPIGTLGRYTLPGYIFLTPLSFLGLEKILTTMTKYRLHNT